MKRLLITGLLGLTLINHVHAGSLTHYLPTASNSLKFGTSLALGAIPGTSVCLANNILSSRYAKFSDNARVYKIKVMKITIAGIGFHCLLSACFLGLSFAKLTGMIDPTTLVGSNARAGGLLVGSVGSLIYGLMSLNKTAAHLETIRKERPTPAM